MTNRLRWTVAAAVALTSLGVLRADANETRVERIEFSAPIFPKVLVMYEKEGANYPATQAEAEAHVRASAVSFPQLLEECAATRPGITLPPADGTPLTPEQLSANFEAVGECSYERYTAKPYWIPQLVDDVDVCGLVLGAGWTLPTEADLAALGDDELAWLRDTLTSTAPGAGWGGFYFSLNVYARGADGKLKDASLAPGVSPRLGPITGWDGHELTADELRLHRESDRALRCIRRRIIEQM